jgi:hypothetical protein
MALLLETIDSFFMAIHPKKTSKKNPKTLLIMLKGLKLRRDRDSNPGDGYPSTD